MPEESPQKLDLRSMDITEEKKQQLKQLFPEVFREDKIDFDHLKRVLGEWVDPGKERFGLNWPGKAECMKTIQQPSIATLRPDREESANFDETEHLFIEGDNLEVLKLLQKSYFGKVKMIYIDPPYNTGNEFIYPDNYTESLDTYLKYTGQKDEEGNWQTTNRDTEGRFHSKWLNMMYSRLFLAKNLLREDGMIFISIDDHEIAHLRKICDEIYGEENFLVKIIWEKRFTRSNNAKMFTTLTESILVYRKSEALDFLREPRSEKADSIYSNPDGDPRGPWTSVSYVNPASKADRPNLVYPITNPHNGEEIVHPTNAWKYDRETHKKHIQEDKLYWGTNKSNTYPRLKKFLSEMDDGMVPVDLWKHEETGTTDAASKNLEELLGRQIFDFPKPASLINRMLGIATDSQGDHIVLDFFAGSCTTAHAVLKQNQEDGGNRKFIMVQLPEPTEEKSEAKKAGFNTIADIGKERIRRVIQQIKEEQKKNKQLELGEDGENGNEQDLGFKVFKLTPSNFKVWEAPGVDIEPEKLKEQLDAFADHLNPETEEQSILYELILKSGFPLTANIETLELAGKTVYNVEDKTLMICLEKELTFELLDAIADQVPQRFICLDSSFSGKDADSLKTNAVQLFQSKEIEFRTV
jgi:adenine-specific DNA-methyltransferase